MFTERGLAAVRIAATLTHMYPSLRIRLCGTDRLLAEVAWPPAPPPPGGAHSVHPCAFRSEIARVWSDVRDGAAAEPMQEPAIGLGVAPGGTVYPSGIAKIPVVDHYVYAFGSTLDPDRCHNIAQDLTGHLEPEKGVLGLGLRGDVDTHVTVTYVDTEPESELLPETEAAVIDLLEELMARYAATQLIDQVHEPRSIG